MSNQVTSDVVEEEYEEEDELDLLALISSDTNNTNQYLIFIGSNEEVYAINVSKVQELLVYKDLHTTPNPSNTSLIKSTADIRDKMTSIINYDEWFGNKILEDKDYELIILAAYGGEHLGIMVKRVEYIMTINLEAMQDTSANNPRTSFVAKIRLSGKERLCTVFDGDRLLADVFDDVARASNSTHIKEDKSIEKTKTILFADDSRYIQKVVSDLFHKLNVTSKIFENGKDLLDYLQECEPEDIGLIITDLEMPVMDGVTLMKEIKKLPKYREINILVHTNMSNSTMQGSLSDIGAVEIIGKMDIDRLASSIGKFYK